jgi:hypothetical protein
MNTDRTKKMNRMWIAFLVLNLMSAAGLRAAESTSPANPATQMIGIYDSRVVAYAWFWSDDQQAKRNADMKAAQAAKDAGDTAQFGKLSKALGDFQQRMHRQVFSTAPADEALAALQKRIPEIQKQAGVVALVSKWDAAALQKYLSAVPVDVTDALVAEFKPAEKQLKMIEDIKKQKPVPLDQIDKMKD